MALKCPIASEDLTLEEALELAANKGYHFLGLKPDTKVPAVKWKDLKDGNKEEVIRGWVKEGLRLGVNCGMSGLVVLDIDVDKITPEMELDCKAVIDKMAALAGGCWAPSPSGGFHFYFRADPRLAIGSPKLHNKRGIFRLPRAEPGAEQVKPKPWAELKGQGGQVCAYRKRDPGAEPRELPWAVLLALYPDPLLKPFLDRMVEDGAQDLLQAQDGERNDTLNAVAYRLAQAGCPERLVREQLGQAAAQIGLTGEEVQKTLSSALGAPGQARPDPRSAYAGAVAAAPAASAPTAPASTAAAVEGVEDQQEGLNAALDAAIASCRKYDLEGKALPLSYAEVMAVLHPGVAYFEDESAKRLEEGGLWLEWLEDSRWEPLERAALIKRVERVVEYDRSYSDQHHNTAVSAAAKRWARNVRAGYTADIDAADDYLLDSAGRAIHLSTGQVVVQSKDKPLLKRLNFRWDDTAQCPLWKECLDRWMEGDQERVRWLQRMAGYTLLPENPLDLFLFFYGTGRNGKSTFLDLLLYVIGKAYAAKMDVVPFLEGKYQKTELTALAPAAGKRFITLSELPDKARWNVPLIKTLSGDDEFPIKKLYRDPTSARAQALVWAVGNSMPTYSDPGDGWIERVRAMGWMAHIPNKDRGLKKRLKNTEADGIGMWMLEGLRDFLANGEQPPASLLLSTKQYLTDYGSIARAFADDMLVEAPGEYVKLAAAFRAYKDWRVRAGYDEDAGQLPRWVTSMSFRMDLAVFLQVINQSTGSGRQYCIMDRKLKEERNG